MDLKQRFFFICLAVAGLSLLASYYLSRRLPLVLAALLPVGAMLLARRPSMSWLAHLSLAGFTSLSAAGIVLNISLMPMVIASAAALASWDLLLEERARLSSGGFSPTRLYERLHLKSLGAALGLGLLGAGAGQWIHWQAPFLGTFVGVIFTLFCLDRAMHYSKRLS